MLELKRYRNIPSFKKEVLSFLMRHEGENSLIIGVLNSLEEDSEPAFMAAVKKDGDLGLVILQTHPCQIILSKPVTFTPDEISELATCLAREYPESPGFIGETRFTTELAKDFSRIVNKQTTVHMKQRIYVLHEVKKKASGKGKLEQAALEDWPLLKEWGYCFAQEVNEPSSKEEMEQKTKEFIEKGRLYVWKIDGRPVSMACSSRPTENNITVSYVYTPEAERKKGYASDCVSALTQLLLDRGYQTTSLYTDLSNPTSNKIYIEIGYEPVMDSIVILLDK
ncbi:GNAT family N-acetyltransferase [Fictibacillus gelatini]|uniref:GNAT family N-acetyltransferase n=1 Tax=Fictibacillus gelatini TaxID=225985 RepID=UPI0003FE3081|nr:GNAT family N-acetyltransferase [Fictibacillus gelatini]